MLSTLGEVRGCADWHAIAREYYAGVGMEAEYRALREKYSMLELCKNPDAVSEVTCFARRRIGADAAIVGSACVACVADALANGRDVVEEFQALLVQLGAAPQLTGAGLAE